MCVGAKCSVLSKSLSTEITTLWGKNAFLKNFSMVYFKKNTKIRWFLNIDRISFPIKHDPRMTFGPTHWLWGCGQTCRCLSQLRAPAQDLLCALPCISLSAFKALCIIISFLFISFLMRVLPLSVSL